SIRLLPPSAAAHLMLAMKAPAPAAPAMGASERWSWFDRQPEKKKLRARERLDALQMVLALQQACTGKVYAMQLAAQATGVALSTLYEWDALIQDVPRPDWLPHLCPAHGGGRGSAECSPEAWDAIRVDYLRAERPNFTACYRRLQGLAAQEGWTIPPERTLHRRMMAIPEAQRVLKREGPDALRRLFPAQQRDRGVFHALEAVNADGHTWDVFVKWPDGTIGRPSMVGFQDLYSGKVLSWRVDQTLSWHGVRLAFGDVVERYGIPSLCWLDNGREFAAKRITGGQANRYRFKVKDEEPEGLLTALGVEVHWTQPYHGQSKPIERAWRDFAQDIAKHPAFAGAYTGNSPTAKPHNYGSTAVPLETFLRVIGEGIAEHNARTGRKSGTAAGRSFDVTFAESYERSPIRMAAPEQRRLWLLAAEAVRVRKQDGQIHLYGNRYWSQDLHAHLGATVTVRFDPDALSDPLHVYATDGRYLGAAEAQEMAGFNSVADAQKQARIVKQFMRSTKESADAQLRMSVADLVRKLPQIEAAEPPEAKIVRPFIAGNTALQPLPREDVDEELDPFEAALARGRVERGSHLRVVDDD
ncbi:MAG: hypothetical protein JWP29_5677, partial [Rhodoferax sp.]|nr:hypothetical protein [Rhodoferax sp.]